jgi:hypothetical protein
LPHAKPSRTFAVMASAVIAAGLCMTWVAARADDGAWTFQIDQQKQPSISYLDLAGKTVFRFGCGGHVVLNAVYPGTGKQEGDKASIAIANKSASMNFAGEIFNGSVDGPPNTENFSQTDLGFARNDPDLYGAKWHQLEDKFFDLLDSGEPLTVSAEGKSYTLPAIKIARWRQQFRAIC